MGTGYTTGGDTWQDIKWQALPAQSFKVDQFCFLHYIKLYLEKGETYGDVRLKISLANGAGEPTGNVKAVALIKPSNFPAGQTQAWITKTLQPSIDADPTKTYVITLEEVNRYMYSGKWIYDANDATYPHGERLLTFDEGASWNHYPNDDHLFYIWGTPPAPPPPPAPPLDKWFPVSIEQTQTETGWDIVLTTDQPSHLWLYYTFEEPWTHRQAATKRGLIVPWNAYWCYVAWIQLEQDEPGDTLTHTFHITALVTCQDIWFRFRGTIGGADSPSDSPIYHKHFVTPPSPFYFNYPVITPYQEHSNTAWCANTFKAQKSGTPNSLRIWLKPMLNHTLPMDVYIEESIYQPPDQTVPYSDMTGHILAHGTIPAADLNTWQGQWHEFIVTLDTSSYLDKDTWYCITNCDNNFPTAYHFRAWDEGVSNHYPSVWPALYPTKPSRTWMGAAGSTMFASSLW